LTVEEANRKIIAQKGKERGGWISGARIIRGRFMFTRKKKGHSGKCHQIFGKTHFLVLPVKSEA